MAGKVTRTMLVVFTAVTLAVGALGVTGGFGPHGVAVAAQSDDGSNASAREGDAEGGAIIYHGTGGWAHGDVVAVSNGGDASVRD